MKAVKLESCSPEWHPKACPYCENTGSEKGYGGVFSQSKDAELTKLKSDVERLKAALMPFGEMGKAFINREERDYPEIVAREYSRQHGKLFTVTIGELRNAARALEETK